MSERTALNVETIITLLRFCLNSTAFHFNNQHYSQIEGVAKGSLVSPVMADIFMDDFESKVLANFKDTPPTWKRFVDNVIQLSKRERSRASAASK